MKRIDGVLQHAQWGDLTAIASVRGVDPSGQPEAEYWLGAHPKAPSRLVGGHETQTETLDAYIATNPDRLLGRSVVTDFAQLPFLLKLLAAAKPLSIQAHPDLTQAQAGFTRENTLGIDVAAPDRNYRDANHKPELICALTSFEAKCGFRDLTATRRLLALFSDSRVVPLQQRIGTDTVGQSVETEEATLSDTVEWLLTLEAANVADLVAGLVADAARLSTVASGDAKNFQKELLWVGLIDEAFPADVGVAVSLLLNHLTLEPGQAVFLDAGNMHAYLSGFGVELMANSDNVLRGGLTAKHIDVAELLDVVSYEAIDPKIQSPDGPVFRYDVPVPEFSLERISAVGQTDHRTLHRCEVQGPEIVLVTQGEVEIRSASQRESMKAGQATFVAYEDGGYDLATLTADALAWRATVGR